MKLLFVIVVVVAVAVGEHFVEKGWARNKCSDEEAALKQFCAQ